MGLRQRRPQARQARQRPSLGRQPADQSLAKRMARPARKLVVLHGSSTVKGEGGMPKEHVVVRRFTFSLVWIIRGSIPLTLRMKTLYRAIGDASTLQAEWMRRSAQAHRDTVEMFVSRVRLANLSSSASYVYSGDLVWIRRGQVGVTKVEK